MTRNGKAFRTTAWIVAGGVLLAAWAVFGSTATAEIAWEIQLRDDVPRIKERIGWLEREYIKHHGPDSEMAEVLRLLREERAEREKARK